MSFQSFSEVSSFLSALYYYYFSLLALHESGTRSALNIGLGLWVSEGYQECFKHRVRIMGE